MASLDPVILLALDSGGIRGLSELDLLSDIMLRLQVKEGLTELAKPCERFDLIGGSGTGGLLALLLGPLQLSVPKAKEVYLKIIQAAFSRVNGWPRPPPAAHEEPNVNDPPDLAPLLKEVVRDALQDEDARMIDPSRGDRCKVLVCMNMVHTYSQPRLIRNYDSSSEESANYPIWEVLRATLSCPGILTVFDPESKTYADMEMPRSLRPSNPSAIVFEEAKVVFPQRKLSGLINLGTGHPGLEESISPVDDFVKTIGRDCELAADEMLRRVLEMTESETQVTPPRRPYSFSSFYFRLSVQQGMYDFKHTEWETQRIFEIEAHTYHYIRQGEISRNVKDIVEDILIGKRPYIVLRRRASV
ncbi:acyl transferase/acyl hydrolase/lysophospholipase [Flagelloscypha sp. PMI_526]|nr:acyl transferase/acyl hydrolase/lysophospholipase [Flagelloscypha sp. PMI_526]